MHSFVVRQSAALVSQGERDLWVLLDAQGITRDDPNRLPALIQVCLDGSAHTVSVRKVAASCFEAAWPGYVPRVPAGPMYACASWSHVCVCQGTLGVNHHCVLCVPADRIKSALAHSMLRVNHCSLLRVLYHPVLRRFFAFAHRCCVFDSSRSVVLTRLSGLTIL